MKRFHLLFFGTVIATAALILPCDRAAGAVTIQETEGGQYDVNIEGKLLTTLRTQGFPKPILYPIIGPHGVRMTRDYPMKEGTPNEAKDHPHHQSLWYTHGNVNGVSFWELSAKAGQIVTTKVDSIKQGKDEASITLHDKWVDPKGNTVCTDQQTLIFHNTQTRGGAESVAIDYNITIHASEGDLVFGDTKEGTMGIRTHPALRTDRGATAVNSDGVTGKAIWGKRSKWVDYSANVDGHTVGIAILDHPSNPRHPTWWHAREYGLVAANPFGISDFERKPKGTGDFKIPQGQSATFRYRFVFHQGDSKAAGIAQAFENYSAD